MAKKKSNRQSWVLPKTTLSQLLRDVRDIEEQIVRLRLEIQAAGMLPKYCDCPGSEIAPRQTTAHLPGCHNGNKAPPYCGSGQPPSIENADRWAKQIADGFPATPVDGEVKP